jgi:hypothetical protein
MLKAFLLAVTAFVSLAVGAARADYAGAKRWFQALDVESRLLIQFAIIFTDDYVALADGMFGRHT